MSGVQEAINQRLLGVPGVAAKLDRLSINEVVGLLGRPDEEVRHYQQATAVRLEKDGPLEPAWKVGDGRPALATDDPAEVVAMNLCVIARTHRSKVSPVAGVTQRHPERCGFCDYPIVELHRAIAHATYFARLVRDHLLIWVGDDHARYVRAGDEDGRYQSPAWEAFAALHAGEQRARVDAVLSAIREGATA